MKHFNVRVLIVSLCLGICSAFLFAGAALGRSCEQWGGKIVSVQGVVQVRKAGESKWMPVGLNATYCPGDMIRVLQNSRAAIVLSNETLFRLDQNTTVTFTGVEKEKTFLIDIFKGVTHFFSRHPRRLKVVTPFLNAAVEGTEFYVRVTQDQTFLSIFEGRVAASNKTGSLVLTAGQSAVARAGQAPAMRVVVHPRDAVQWALYYLPVIYVPPGEVPKEDMSDPRFLAYRASQLLAVGRVDEAGADIERALSLDPKYSDAFALQSIIAVVQNEKDKALSSAQKAIDTGPNSATARIAMSYARQAGFDLEGARTSVEAAVKLDPNNALAWARLAELWSSFGRLGKALDAAKKAIGLDPSLSRTQMVLGFAYLTQVKTSESKTAFEKAIELDQADPLSRLGLGLAKIREGDLKAGGREIEIAASLDPNNSLVRSYLGKTYYEEKRTDLDGREYAIAKELDPNDPTPWFYDAIAKQTTNRPVEALHDMQKAIELNDNRAVFRSKLLLDSDLAARSSSLARIYNNLGFQQRGLVEGWNSVNTDPTNFSAHRFLSDSYAVLPRHEIARVSELLQSQLLQPINITPIQPGLTESNLFLISAQGPVSAGFNTFNPLFNRNQATLQASGLRAENDTWGGEGIVSGIYNKLSLSAGYNHFETDGWRDNADQNDDIANVYAQYELSYKTSVQAEYRYRDTDRGDTQMRFFDDDFRPRINQDDKTKSVRLGLRHSFSPNSVLIGNFSYQDKDFNQRNEPGAIFGPSGPSITLEEYNFDDDATSAELGYIFRSKYADIVSGAGYFDIDSDLKLTTVIFFPSPPFPPPPFGPGGTSESDITRSDLGVEHTNLYLYSHINFPKNVTWTFGASGDFLDSDSQEGPDEDQFNPKFGITWTPFSGTTFRGAAFKVLKRTLLTDQTLEPTQVAGFNQFFDDADGTKSKRYGAAIDQKFSKTIFGGFEYSKRDLKVPFLRTGRTPGNVDWDEKLIRAYLNWAPHKWFALTAEYLYEEFDRDKRISDGALWVDTHYVPLGINFYHPSGLSAHLKGTYVDQKGKFERIDNIGTFTRGQDDFWLLDAAISYRLPKRYGFITVGAANLLDEEFQYFGTDRDNPRIQPERYIFGKITLAFP
jgi:tetratricopeptide (TPR) repeat protein